MVSKAVWTAYIAISFFMALIRRVLRNFFPVIFLIPENKMGGSKRLDYIS
jgi:hypothetical protein